MAHDAFISYSQEDKAIADSICQALEKRWPKLLVCAERR